MQTRKCDTNANADTEANAYANEIHTKNKMSPSPEMLGPGKSDIKNALTLKELITTAADNILKMFFFFNFFFQRK